ncbi:MAG: N-acetyltransferase [Cyclobacteriaceae bacterium]|nr:N-acetyltransferase [Cyclobacteriaceae bacterium]
MSSEISKNYKVNPLSEVQTTAIGEGTTIWQYCVVLKGARIGNNCNINCQVFIENDVVIGNNVTIKPGVQIWDGITLEDDVFIGPNVTFTNDLVPRSKHYPDTFLRTTICRGASLGANATILGGITIGAYAVIGAGSVVTKDIPPFTLWYGNPAIHKGYVTKGGEVIALDLISRTTGNKYKMTGDGPVPEI